MSARWRVKAKWIKGDKEGSQRPIEVCLWQVIEPIHFTDLGFTFDQPDEARAFAWWFNRHLIMDA